MNELSGTRFCSVVTRHEVACISILIQLREEVGEDMVESQLQLQGARMGRLVM